MTDVYGIPAGTIPGFAEAGGGQFMSVKGLPDRTVPNMVTFMDKLRGKPDIRFSTRAGRRPVPAARTLPPGTVPRTGRPWPPVPSRPLSPRVPVRPARHAGPGGLSAAAGGQPAWQPGGCWACGLWDRPD